MTWDDDYQTLMELADQAATPDVCRFCGCTDARACPHGCYWIVPGLCSACAVEQLARQGVAQTQAVRDHTAVALDMAAQILAGVPGQAAQAQGLPRLWRPGDPV